MKQPILTSRTSFLIGIAYAQDLFYLCQYSFYPPLNP